MKKKTRIVELVISDDSQELTIDAISLVSSPAIEEDFVFFGKEKNNLTFAKVDEEKRMLISPALIPLKNIYRYDAATDSDYYVYFSKETVAQAAALYLKHNNHHKATYEHQDRVSGVLTVESWIKEGEQDKSNLYGFKGLPLGTWFVKMKIENDELWEKIKSGEVKGLSIEGYFIDRMETMSKKEPTTEEVRTALKELLSVQKVDLTALPHFILKSAKEGLKDILGAIKKLDVAENAATGASMKKTDADNKITDVKRMYNDVLPKLKELGLNESDVPEIKEAKNILSEYYNKESIYRSILSGLSKK